jgi:hypothetical protein
MPKAKKHEMVKSKVLLVLTVETPVEPPENDEEMEIDDFGDNLFDGLVSPDMEAAMNETLRNWYQSEAQISIADAVTVEPPADKRRKPQFKLTRSGGLIQTV